jgi:hypothetical protein
MSKQNHKKLLDSESESESEEVVELSIKKEPKVVAKVQQKAPKTKKI